MEIHLQCPTDRGTDPLILLSKRNNVPKNSQRH